MNMGWLTGSVKPKKKTEKQLRTMKCSWLKKTGDTIEEDSSSIG